jgi:hypothetical protein
VYKAAVLLTSNASKEKLMTSTLLALWALTGGGLATWLMMHIWLPDPPPDVYARYAMILIAGLVGGVLGGYLVHGALTGSDPMPGISSIVGAGGGALILSGAVAFLGAPRRS